MKRINTLEIVISFTLVLLIVLTGLSLYEWWNVVIGNGQNEYVWGTANEQPWFYQSSELYAKVNLVEGIVTLILLLALISFLVQGRKKPTIYTLVCFIVVFLMTILNSHISRL